MTHGWAGLAVLGDAATAGSGAVNAMYFTGRAARARGPRAMAAGVLALLFGGCAVQAISGLATGGGGGGELALRAPLLLANLATSVLLARGYRR